VLRNAPWINLQRVRNDQSRNFRLESGENGIAPFVDIRFGQRAAFNVEIQPRQFVTVNDGLIFRFERRRVRLGNGQFRSRFAAERDNHIAAATANRVNLTGIKIYAHRNATVPGGIVPFVRDDEGDGVKFLAASVGALRDLEIVVRSDIHVRRKNPCRPAGAERGGDGTQHDKSDEPVHGENLVYESETGLLFQAAINRKNLPKRPFSSSPLADARCAGRLYTLPERDETARDESAPPHPQAGTLVGHPGENSLPQTEPRWSVFQPGQSSPARTSRAQTPRPSGYGSAVRESAAGAWLPLPSQKPFIRFKIVFQQIRMAVCAPHFEIIGTGPFGFALDLMPTVEDFLHLDGLFFPAEATRRLVGLGSGVTFNLDRGELHLRVFRQGFA